MVAVINIIALMISIMVSIAFFTLLERKIISYTQNRKGPNKILVKGVLQPMSDAIKLISKELNMNYKSNLQLFLVSPAINIFVAMLAWLIFPYVNTFSFMKMSMIFLIACLSVNSIAILIMSWSSNSNYSFVGMIRALAQIISYEVNLMMILIAIMNVGEQMSLATLMNTQKYISISIVLPALTIMWLITSLAETSRTPFDFSEGESELVSGFNIEYGSSSFMLLFLAEYASIILMSMVTTMAFFCENHSQSKTMIFLMVCAWFVWVRVTLPRFRYDKMMKFNWVWMLPSTTVVMMMTFMMKIY